MVSPPFSFNKTEQPLVKRDSYQSNSKCKFDLKQKLELVP